MAKSKPKIQKRLAKLVLTALLCTGGVQTFISPSVAEAGGTVTLSGVTYKTQGSSKIHIYETIPENSMEHSYYAVPKDPTVTTVIVTGGNYEMDNGELGILGGAGLDINLTGHEVIVTGGTIEGKVIGAVGSELESIKGVEVSGNSVTVSGDDTVIGKVAGGVAEIYYYTADVLSSGNKVTIDGGNILGSVYGGEVRSEDAYGFGDVTNNEVKINNGTFTFDSTMAMPRSGSADIAGGFTEKGNASNNNRVTINNGTFRASIIDRGTPEHPLTYSTITISGGATKNGDATDNHVTINNGTFETEDSATISGITISGGATLSGKANKNTVTINGGTFKNSTTLPPTIYGGGGTVEASNNTVTVNTSMVGVSIYGGQAFDNVWDYEQNAPVDIKGTAANNTVNILKPHNAFVLLYGGDGDETTSTGNTLNLAAKDVTAGWVNYFQNIALTDALTWDNGKTVLSATNFDSDDSIKATLDISAAANLKNAGSGTMTLLASGTDNDFSSLNLKYYDNNTATLNSGTSSVDVFEKSNYENEKNGVTLTYDTKHTVALDITNYNKVTYTVVANSAVKTVSFGNSIAWSEGGTVRDVSGEGFTFNGTTAINAANLGFTGKANTALKTDGSSFMTLVKGATGITDTNLTPITAGNGTVDVAYEDAGKIKYAATASGAVSVDATAGDVKYTVDKVTLSSVDIGGWNGTESAVPTGWTADGSVAVNNAAAITVTPTATQTILTATSGMFADVDVTKEVAFDPVTKNGVTLTGTRTNRIKTTQTNVANDTIVYEVGKKDVKTIDIGAVKWQKDATLFDGSDTDYNYANVTALGTDNFAVTYEKPENVAANDSMTLLKANETLQKMAEQTKSTSYSCAPVSGVTIDASITGKLAASGGKVTFTAAENKASKLTFGDVEWKDSGALLNHKTTLANVSFNGAAVDTSKIRFTNMIYLDADQQMTLVSDFGDSVGTITGDKYMVGTAFEGEGKASLEGSNLIFRTKTSAGVSEQTHKAVMGVEATMALMASGREYQSKIMDGLGDPANAGKDGTTTAVAIGGDHSRVETGSHVSANTWNAAVGVGATKETKKGTLQYGIFGEYGKASYTLHSDAGKSDGDAHYAGGGILAKWTNKHDVYAEASFRLGRVSDNANDLLRDAAGNAYGYDIHANYFGAHVGVGKVFNYKGGKSLDVYGKYFYTRRDGAEFDAVQHYNLDSVSSSVLRIGARYGSNGKKWNWYGGLAYEYEFDGESKGTVNGTEIRAASIKGSSVRAELGMRMDATKTNPWQTDISIYGYGGKHRGFGGNVSVAYTF